MSQIKNIKEVTETLKEEILKGEVHTIEGMRAWLKKFWNWNRKEKMRSGGIKALDCYGKHESLNSKKQMKLLIENWGPIVSAEIDLTKRLIVFTGPNGTGKTYISYWLYGLMSSIGAKPYSNIQNHNDDRYYTIFHGDDL